MKGLKTAVIKKEESPLNLFSEKYSAVFVTNIPGLADEELEENTEHLPVLALNDFSPQRPWLAKPTIAPAPGYFGWFPSSNVLHIQIDGQRVEVVICDRQESPEENALYSS